MKTAAPRKRWGRENERKKSSYVLPGVCVTNKHKALKSTVGLFFGNLFWLV